MADIQHKDLTDNNIHEPKGITTALAGQVYVADGSNSGDWMFPSGHAYGEIYIAGGATAQTLPVSSGTAVLNPTDEWTGNGFKNVTVTPASGTITILSAGEYQLNFYITFNTASIASGAKYNFHYAINGTPSTRKLITAKNTSGVDTLNISAIGYAQLAANDVVSIFVGGDATSSNTAITVLESGFSVLLVEPA
jgi:hypothetical protein